MLNSHQSCHTWILMIVSILFFSCEKEEIEITDADIASVLGLQGSVAPFFDNPALPVGRDSLRILAIGNSYTEDGTAYIEEIMDGLGVARERYCVYTLVHSAATLKYWWEEMEHDAPCVLNRVAGNVCMVPEDSSLTAAVSLPWDVVVVQQFSGDAIDYRTFNPWLRQIIGFVRGHCSNGGVAMAWQLVHSYRSGFAARYSDSAKRWRMLAYATAQMMVYDGINIIIPTGTAIQLARGSGLNNVAELTRDGTHLGYGVARYVAACVWVQTLCGDAMGLDVRRCSALHPLLGYESDERHAREEFIRGSSVPVTELNRGLCIECAYRACRSPFEI